jgi:hypothetical protein
VAERLGCTPFQQWNRDIIQGSDCGWQLRRGNRCDLLIRAWTPPYAVRSLSAARSPGWYHCPLNWLSRYAGKAVAVLHGASTGIADFVASTPAIAENELCRYRGRGILSRPRQLLPIDVRNNAGSTRAWCRQRQRHGYGICCSMIPDCLFGYLSAPSPYDGAHPVNAGQWAPRFLCAHARGHLG